MGLLIALAIVAVLGIPVAVILLLIGQARLRERVAALERALSVVGSVQAAEPVPSGPVTDDAAPVMATPSVEAAVAPIVAAPGPWETAAVAPIRPMATRNGPCSQPSTTAPSATATRPAIAVSGPINP